MSETTQQRIERIAEECANTVTIENFLDLKNAIVGALTAFAEEEAKDRQDQEVELMMHQCFMDDLLDDLGAPRHPDNDPKRPKYGPYGRLKAYAEAIGIKASIWQPLPEAPKQD